MTYSINTQTIGKSIFLMLFAALIFSCNNEKEAEETTVEDALVVEESIASNSDLGYELMQQKCLICHFEKPDPSRKDEMLAPPMLRVQEHYKPSYPNKEEFIEAVLAWVKNPSEENTLMPGAVRKFNLMTKLPYEDADIKIIAAALYEIDFGEMPKGGKGMPKRMQLNDGKKWKINQRTVSSIGTAEDLLVNFNSDELVHYNQLGRDVFDVAKTIMLDNRYSEEMFDQLHGFFGNIEENMHLLIAAQSTDNAKVQRDILIEKFSKFWDYFELE